MLAKVSNTPEYHLHIQKFTYAQTLQDDGFYIRQRFPASSM